MAINSNTIKLILLVLVCTLNARLNAQNYPVQSTVFLTPPYTLSLPQYASSDRLTVQLLNKDFATPVVQVYLQLRIDGPSISIETKPIYRSAQPISLTAGVPSQLNSQDIADLFNPTNLTFQGLNESQFIAGGSYLPEGLYSFSIVAKEYHNAVQVSNWGSATTGIFKHLPPIINLPFDKSYINNQTPQFFQIQFTPRHTISADLMQSVRYRIRMNEVYPATRNPNEVMQSSSLPFFETITEQTSFVYSASDPLLMEGRTYAVQVQAIDVNGKDIFDNNGWSQVVSFIYGSACPTPQNIITTAGDGIGLQINWEPNQRCRSYVVYYKEVTEKLFLSAMAYSNQLLIPQLKPNQIYQIKVSGVCAENESEPSAIINFKTIQNESAYQQFAKNCGAPLPSIDMSNKQALAILETGDVIKAADFDIKVSAASGSDGWFSGAGFVTLPFTGKVPLPCTFEHIFLNTDKRLLNGQIKILQAPLELSDRTVKNIGKTWRTLFGNNWNRFGDLKYAGSIKKVTTSDNGEISIEGSNGIQKIPKGSNTILTDANGKKYFISAGGQVSEAEGPCTTPIVKDFNTGEGTPTSLPPGMAKVFFKANVQEAYDAMTLAQLTAGKTYDQLESSDTTYYAGWKLIRTGDKINVEAQVVQSKKWPCPLDSIRFVRSDGTLLPTSRNGNTFSIQVNGRLNLYADAIWAVATFSITPKQAPQRWILGKLNLINVDVKKQTIVLVPVNGIGADIEGATIESKMNQLLKAYALQFNVKMGLPLTVKEYDEKNEVLEAEKTNIQLGYSTRLNRFIAAYKNKNTWLQKNRSTDTAYVFVLNQAKDGVKGFMSLGETYGFVFLNNAELNPHTVAHEIGHGRFQLEHVFGNDLNKAANSQNLMDYAPPFAWLNFDQWMQIFDPQIKVNSLANEDRSKSLAISDISKFKPLANADGTYTFISHSGEYITLEEDAKNLKFSTLGRGYLVEEKEGVEVRKTSNYLFPLGCLMGFESKGIKYKARMGLGYVDDNDKQFVGELASNESKAGIMPYLVFGDNAYHTKAALFKTRLNHLSVVKTGEGEALNSFSVIDFETAQLNKDYASAIASKKVGDKLIEEIGANFTIFGNDKLNFKYKDTLYNASQFLIHILSSQRSVADYVYYFNLANLKPNAYASFVNCLSDKIQERAIGIQQQFITRHQSNKGESTVLAQYINSNSEALFESINAIQLKDLATGAAQGVELANTIHKAYIEQWKADYLYNYFKNNTPKECEFTAIESAERIYAINALIANTNYWRTGDLHLINTLLRTTPNVDELEILQKGAMANRYAWLQQLWKSKEDEDIEQAFEILNTWVYEHYTELKIEQSTAELMAEDLVASGLTYEKRRNEFYVGIKAETDQLNIVPQQFTLSCIGTEWFGGIQYQALPSAIQFDGNGGIEFLQTYWINDIRPQLYSPEHPPHLKSVVAYAEVFSPFQIITVTLGGNYFELGLSAGQTMEMPAFMAMQLQDRLEQQVVTERTRRVVNMVVIGVTAISAVATGGTSLNLAATLFLAASAADLEVGRLKSNIKTQAEWAAYQDFFYEWEAFHTAAEYAMAVEGMYALGKVLPKYGTRVNLIKSWNRLKKFCKNNLLSTAITNILNRLKKRFTLPSLKVGDKVLGYSIDRIRPGTNGKIFLVGRAMGNSRVKGIKDIYEELKKQGYDNIEIFDVSSLEGDWKKRFIEANKEFSDLTNEYTIKLTNEQLKLTKMYKLDQDWIEFGIKENITFLDFGDLYLKSGIKEPNSLFYDMELSLLFN